MLKNILNLSYSKDMVKRLLAIAVFGVLAFASIPADSSYFGQLQADVDTAPYLPKNYKLNVFDCSNMSNLLDDWLEILGYKADLVAFWTTTPDGTRRGHVMVLVDNTVLVEATTKRIQPFRLIPTDSIIFPDAEILQKYTTTEHWKAEWDYSNNPHHWEGNRRKE